jgi:hypothetical protein
MQGGGLILRSTPSRRLEIKKLGQPQQRVTIDRRSISGTHAGLAAGRCRVSARALPHLSEVRAALTVLGPEARVPFRASGRPGPAFQDQCYTWAECVRVRSKVIALGHKLFA